MNSAAFWAGYWGASAARSSNRGPHVCMTSEDWFKANFIKWYLIIAFPVILGCAYKMIEVARDSTLTEREFHKKLALWALIVVGYCVLTPIIAMYVVKPIMLADASYMICGH